MKNLIKLKSEWQIDGDTSTDVWGESVNGISVASLNADAEYLMLVYLLADCDCPLILIYVYAIQARHISTDVCLVRAILIDLARDGHFNQHAVCRCNTQRVNDGITAHHWKNLRDISHDNAIGGYWLMHYKRVAYYDSVSSLSLDNGSFCSIAAPWKYHSEEHRQDYSRNP